MVGIAFDVDHLRSHVLGAVTDRMDDDTATDGTIWAGAAGLGRSGDLAIRRLSVQRLQLEAEDGDTDRPGHTRLEEGPPRDVHKMPPPPMRENGPLRVRSAVRKITTPRPPCQHEPSQAHQVENNFRVTLLDGPDVEHRPCHLVDERHGVAVGCEIDRLEITLARVAGFDANRSMAFGGVMRKLVLA